MSVRGRVPGWHTMLGYGEPRGIASWEPTDVSVTSMLWWVLTVGCAGCTRVPSRRHYEAEAARVLDQQEGRRGQVDTVHKGGQTAIAPNHVSNLIDTGWSFRVCWHGGAAA